LFPWSRLRLDCLAKTRSRNFNNRLSLVRISIEPLHTHTYASLIYEARRNQNPRIIISHRPPSAGLSSLHQTHIPIPQLIIPPPFSQNPHPDYIPNPQNPPAAILSDFWHANETPEVLLGFPLTSLSTLSKLNLSAPQKSHHPTHHNFKMDSPQIPFSRPSILSSILDFHIYSNFIKNSALLHNI
jgi:hypothetical protein